LLNPDPMAETIFAGVETGGTKTLCRLVTAGGGVLAEMRWPTEDPGTMAVVLSDFIRGQTPSAATLAAVGLASFGPLIVNPAAPDCGRMQATPKPGWTGSNLAAALAKRLGAPVCVDTDVNAAAIAEQRLGAGRGLSSVAYVTVGTGIGGGLANDGRALKGALHPEIGHIRMVRRPGDATPSACPYHADCVEGLVAGPALRRRLGEGRRLADDEAVMTLVADYLGQLMGALVFAWSPQRIVLGGGVMGTAGLIDLVAAAMPATLGAYGVGEAAGRPGFLVPAALENAGLEGAVLMAQALAAHPSSLAAD